MVPNERGQTMKFSTIMTVGLVVLGTASLATANPALLPRHPGYPAAGYANDSGQINLTHEQSLKAAAASEDAHIGQTLTDPNNGRKLHSQGAGRLPTVDGPNIAINPPATEATHMPKN